MIIFLVQEFWLSMLYEGRDIDDTYIRIHIIFLLKNNRPNQLDSQIFMNDPLHQTFLLKLI